MQRSEMIKALANNFSHVYEIQIHAETIIAFLESQGMQPPPINVEAFLVPAEGDSPASIPYTTSLNEWEPEE